MKVLYFTATGNNLYIAKRLSGECFSIPKLLKEGCFNIEDEKIGIIFPVFHGGVPKIVEEFLDKSNLKGSYIFGIASYGSFVGGATQHLLEIGERNGVKFSYIDKILMIDNWLPIFDINRERKKEARKNIEQNLNRIINNVKENKVYIKRKSIFGNHVRILQLKKYNVQFEKKFSVESNCNGCKVCEKVCPVDNIKIDRSPYFEGNCQQCLACTHNCPQNAIRLKRERSKARFTNQNVSLKEIIAAND